MSSFYRKSVWFIKGLREYTKSGYLVASKHFDPNELETDCSGKTYLITGANSGIGRVCALEVAKRGGSVHLACRNHERGTKAVEDIKQNTGNQNVHLHILDMSELKNVIKFAKEFSEQEEQLNCLINNAGCMVNERQLTNEGFEKNFATNSLGIHILTSLLIPLLSKTDSSRVISVTSGGLLLARLDHKDPQLEKMNPFDGSMSYCQQKRQQIILTEHYAKKYPKIFFATMHPGWADTPAVQQSLPDFYDSLKSRLRSPEAGADTLVWLTVSNSISKFKSGLFFQDRTPVKTHLPLSRTHSSEEEINQFISVMDTYMEQLNS